MWTNTKLISTIFYVTSPVLRATETVRDGGQILAYQEDTYTFSQLETEPVKMAAQRNLIC